MSAWLQHWVLNGGLIDTIVALTIFEVAALLLFRYLTKRGLKPRDYLLNIASGLCLMLALRSALASSDWSVISVFLLAAGIAHTADIVMRLRALQSNK